MVPLHTRKAGIQEDKCHFCKIGLDPYWSQKTAEDVSHKAPGM